MKNEKIEQYIIDAIDASNYELEKEPRTVAEKVRFLWATFNSEYAHGIERYGISRAIREWLQGLPSSCNVEYHNHEILKLDVEWGELSAGSNDSEQDGFLEDYFGLIAQHVQALFERYCSTYRGERYQVIAKEWFDRINGNSYFSARLFKNGELFAVLPFQYGYGSQFTHEAKRALKERFINSDSVTWDAINQSEKIENCLKRDCKEWGTAAPEFMAGRWS